MPLYTIHSCARFSSMVAQTFSNWEKTLHSWRDISLTETVLSYIQKRTRALIQYKMTSYQYRKSHCGDKTILRPSYLHNGISYTGKMTSLYWIGAQIYHNASHRIAYNLNIIYSRNIILPDIMLYDTISKISIPHPFTACMQSNNSQSKSSQHGFV